MQLELLILISTQLADLKKAKQGILDFGDTSKKTAEHSALGLRQVQMELRNMLYPISMVRRTIFQLGTVWALTFGGLIALAVKSSERFVELDKLARRYRMSIQEAGKYFYNLTVTDKQIEQAQKFRQEWIRFQKDMKNIGTEAGNFIVKAWYNINEAVARGLLISRAQAAVEEEVAEKRKKGIKVTQEWINREIYDRSNLYKRQEEADKKAAERASLTVRTEEEAKAAAEKTLDIRMQLMQATGNEIGVLKEKHRLQIVELENLGIYKDSVKENYEKIMEIETDRLERSRWGFSTYIDAISSMRKKFGKDTVDMFSNVFVDYLDNDLKNAREIFAAFFTDLRKMFIDFLMNEAIQKVFSYMKDIVAPIVSSFITSVITHQPAATTATPVPTTTTATQATSIGTYYPSYQHGGWAGLSGPQRITVGEHEPEYITPASKMGGAGSQTVNYYINAVDAASFAELVSRNPNAIVAVTNRALRQNKNLRKTIKEYA